MVWFGISHPASIDMIGDQFGIALVTDCEDVIGIVPCKDSAECLCGVVEVFCPKPESSRLVFTLSQQVCQLYSREITSGAECREGNPTDHSIGLQVGGVL